MDPEEHDVPSPQAEEDDEHSPAATEKLAVSLMNILLQASVALTDCPSATAVVNAR